MLNPFTTTIAPPPPELGRLRPYLGPERRRDLGSASLMSQVLDEIDYGLLLLTDDRQVLHANHAARAEMSRHHPLQLMGKELRARRSQDVAVLHDALQAAAHRGLRRLVVLGDDALRIELSVVPMQGHAWASHPATALVMLGRRQVCGELSVQAFARAHGLSPGEESVLRSLCEGLSPTELAQRHGVKIATVRTQIASIRAKTGADSILRLLQQVARLPPLVSTLRMPPMF